jgi:tRNA dimethylallyltransferase
VNKVENGRRPPLIAVVGTNASGKSRLGIVLAKRCQGEVVSADSRQVYRGLDIGTGKLSKEEMGGIPHHLIDVADPSMDRFSLADFQTLAYGAISAIQERGRLPIVVGGTGLYVRAITEGYVLAPAPPRLERRSELEALDDSTLWHTLATLDEEAARITDPRNRRRVIRAIEILEHGSRLVRASSNRPRYRVLQLGVTWPPDVLRQRILFRLRDRIEAGMIDEARNLSRQGVTSEVMDALGLEYRFLAKFLKGEYRDESEFVEKLSAAIYRFSRRQLSWFKKDQGTVWLDTSEDYVAQAVGLVRDFVARPGAGE